MIAGVRPFRGEHQAAVMYSIVHEAPPSLSGGRADVPEKLERMIMQALEKDPDEKIPEFTQCWVGSGT